MWKQKDSIMTDNVPAIRVKNPDLLDSENKKLVFLLMLYYII